MLLKRAGRDAGGTLRRSTPAVLYGSALVGRNVNGRSREVLRPAGAARIIGIAFTTTAAVAMSP